MLLWTRVSLGTLFAATAVAATALAWHNQRACPAPPVTVQMAPAPQVIEEPQSQVVEPAPSDDPQPQVVESDDPTPDETPDPPAASAGEIIDLFWVPGFVRTFPADDAADLVAFVDDWVRADGIAPAIEYRKGAVFAETTEDRGNSGPPPRSAGPEATRACGTQALWMRDSLKVILESNPVTCSQNVCFYRGTEGGPSGYLVFHRYRTLEDVDTFALDAWIQVYDDGLAKKAVDHLENDLLERIDRLPRGCRGEPEGAY